MDKRQYRCDQMGPCFGRGITGRCHILSATYPDRDCPFQKPKSDVTKGKLYPYDEYYGMK